MNYLTLLICILLPVSVSAERYYQCTNSDGSIIFQSEACSENQSSKPIDIEISSKKSAEPWYKNRGSAHTVGSADPVNGKTKRTKEARNKADKSCQKYKDRLQDAEDTRWDIKKRRHYSREQKQLYEQRISEAKKAVAQNCNAKNKGLRAN